MTYGTCGICGKRDQLRKDPTSVDDLTTCFCCQEPCICREDESVQELLASLREFAASVEMCAECVNGDALEDGDAEVKV